MRPRPTVDLLVAFVVVFALKSVAGVVGLAGLFVLGPPVWARPLSLVLSVYAHATLAHLVANSIALVLFGFAVERYTTRFRFHAFFLVTGVVAGLAEVWLRGLFGPAPSVIGASGAIFGLLGYLLTSNSLSSSLLDRLRLGGRAQLVVFATVALVLTLFTSAPRVALIAHFTGLLVGLLAGRVRLLHVRR